MYKITDVQTLGAEYTVVDKHGNVIDKVQVMSQDDILEATMGLYSEEQHGSFSEYLEKSRQLLSNYDSIDQHRILWYSTTDHEVKIATIVEYAIHNGYNKIILEYIEDDDIEF